MRICGFAFLADENIHPEAIDYLRKQGCDVVTVDELNLRGARDEQIVAAGVANRRLIVTHDGDFGTLMTMAGLPIYGIVYLRPGHIRAEFTIAMLETLFESELDLTAPFLVVATRKDNVVRVRVRTLGSSAT